MVRERERITTRQTWPLEFLTNAVEAVISSSVGYVRASYAIWGPTNDTGAPCNGEKD